MLKTFSQLTAAQPVPGQSSSLGLVNVVGPLPSRDAPYSVGDAVVFIKEQEKISTRKATERDVRNFERWLLENRFELRNMTYIPDPELDVYLADFFVSVRKSDGTEYEPDSLTSMRYSPDRHLRENNCTPLTDPPFRLALKALNAKRRELKKQGKGRRDKASDALSQEETKKIWEQGLFGTGSGKSLITTLWWFNGVKFGLRGRDGHRQMRWGDVVGKIDPSGAEYLELLERESKTRDGGDMTEVRDTTPKSWCNGTDRCHVCLYKIYANKRPQESLTPDSPFYLSVIPDNVLQKQKGDVWYFPRPMGVNTISSLMKEVASACALYFQSNEPSVVAVPPSTTLTSTSNSTSQATPFPSMQGLPFPSGVNSCHPRP